MVTQEAPVASYNMTLVLHLQGAFPSSSNVHHVDVEAEICFSVRKERYIWLYSFFYYYKYLPNFYILFCNPYLSLQLTS